MIDTLRRYSSSLADILTLSRFFLSAYLVYLGWWAGQQAVSQVVAVVLLAWVTDVVDGLLARWSHTDSPSWVGQHDGVADLALCAGILAYLMWSDFIPVWLGTLVILTMFGAYYFHSIQLAWPFFSVSYGLLLYFAFVYTPSSGWLMAGYITILFIAHGQRLFRRFLPQLWSAVRSLFD